MVVFMGMKDFWRLQFKHDSPPILTLVLLDFSMVILVPIPVAEVDFLQVEDPNKMLAMEVVYEAYCPINSYCSQICRPYDLLFIHVLTQGPSGPFGVFPYLYLW